MTLIKSFAFLAFCLASSELTAQRRLESSIGQRVRLLTVADAHGERSSIAGDVISVAHDTLLLRISGARSSAAIGLGDIRAAWYAADSTRLNGALAGARRGGAASAALILPLLLLESALSEREFDSDSRTTEIAGVGVVVVVVGSTAVGFVKRTTRWKRFKHL